jgi:hypothetical protein
MNRGASSKVTGFAVLHSKRPLEVKECSFERFVRENEIPEIVWKDSPVVRQWVKKHANSRYVPEFLLTALDIAVKPDLTEYREAM